VRQFRLKSVFAVVAIAAIAIIACQQYFSAPTDAELSAKLIGVWSDSDDIFHFHIDQTFMIFEYGRDSQSNGGWEMENGVLHMSFGHGSMSGRFDTPIKILDSGMTLEFDDQHELRRNPKLERQYNAAFPGILNPQNTGR